MRKLSRFLNFVIIALIFVIGVGAFYLKSQPESQIAKPIAKSLTKSHLSQQDLDNIVNMHIKKTAFEAQKTKMITEKSAAETQKMLIELERLKKIQEQKEIADIPLDRQIWKNDQNLSLQSSETVLEGENQISKMNEEEKKEYARQWKENALKEGYLLELSPDLEVIRFTPIRKPSLLDDSVESYPSD